MAKYESDSDGNVEENANEVQGMIEAGATNLEIRQTLELSDSGLIDVIRYLLQERLDY